MAVSKAVLTNVGDSIVIDLPNEWNGVVAAQIASGADTFTVDATLDEINWVSLLVTNVATLGQANTIIAPGIFYAEFVAFKKVRLIKTVGVAAISCALSIQNG